MAWLSHPPQGGSRWYRETACSCGWGTYGPPQAHPETYRLAPVTSLSTGPAGLHTLWLQEGPSGVTVGDPDSRKEVPSHQAPHTCVDPPPPAEGWRFPSWACCFVVPHLVLPGRGTGSPRDPAAATHSLPPSLPLSGDRSTSILAVEGHTPLCHQGLVISCFS